MPLANFELLDLISPSRWVVPKPHIMDGWRAQQFTSPINSCDSTCTHDNYITVLLFLKETHLPSTSIFGFKMLASLKLRAVRSPLNNGGGKGKPIWHPF